MSKLSNLATIYRHQKINVALSFLASGIWAHSLKFFGEMFKYLQNSNHFFRIYQLKRQSTDPTSVESFSILLDIIAKQKTESNLIVPNYLEKAFGNIQKMFSYPVIVSTLKNDLNLHPNTYILISKSTKIGLDKISPYVNSLNLVFENDGFLIMSNQYHGSPLPSWITSYLDTVKLSSEKYQVIESDGAKFKIRSGSNDLSIVEEVQNEYFSWKPEALVNVKTAIDIGSQIGSFSIFLATKNRSTLKSIHCFEPEPENFKLLSENIKINQLEDVVYPHGKAVSNKNGTAELFVSSDNTGGNKIGSIEPSSDKTVVVETLDIKEFLNALPEIDLLKIDIEGWEHVVIECMGDEILKFRSIIGELQRSEFGSPSKTLKLLQKFGFKTEFKGNEEQMIFFATRVS